MFADAFFIKNGKRWGFKKSICLIYKTGQKNLKKVSKWVPVL